jgi:hypothetical protein
MERNHSTSLVVSDALPTDRVVALWSDCQWQDGACFQILGDGDTWFYRYHKTHSKLRHMKSFKSVPVAAIQSLRRGLAHVDSRPELSYGACRMLRPLLRDRKGGGPVGCGVVVGTADGMRQYGFGFEGEDWANIAAWAGNVPEHASDQDEDAVLEHLHFGIAWMVLAKDWGDNEQA